VLADVFAISPAWSVNFLLILTRISAAVVAMPLLGARGVPAQAKIGLAVLLSLIVLPLQTSALPAAPPSLLHFAVMAGSEAIVGLSIGIAVSMVFHALEMGAELVGVQMGFGMASVLDPLTGGSISTLEQFYRVLVTLIFFAVNGHYLVILGLVHTFEVVPPGSADITLIAGERVMPFFVSLFLAAVRIALPATGALMLADLAMALVGRTVPQMNVLIVGFPVKVGVGLLVIAAAMPLITAFMANVFGRALVDVNALVGR
jgi:flagellar biosynthesis protein FliR